MTTKAGGVAETLIGRESAARRMTDLIDGRGPARAIVVAGEPGMGASALWRTGVDRARSIGATVLRSRPAEDELGSTLVALHDLFDGTDVPDPVLDPDTDRFARGRAVLASLREMADDGPLVLAVDEVQWVDASSAHALRYALRRLDHEPVTVLVSARTAPAGAPPDLVAGAPRLEVVPVAPLDLDSIIRVVRTVVPHLPRPVLEQIHRRSGGNPLYAVELARSADRLRGELDSWVPPTLMDALSARIGDLSPEVQQVLEVAAALGPAPIDTLTRACADVARVDPAGAFDEGVLIVDDGRARVGHPMLASAALHRLNPVRLRRIHADLADGIADPDERARHLALSGAEPDERVASELEAAATRAARRGASGLAAELARHSVRLTPADRPDDAVRRELVEIGHRAAAGDVARAIEQSNGLLPTIGSRRARVSALTQMVALDFSHAEDLLARAAHDAGDDDRRLAGVLELHAWALRAYRGDLHRSRALGDEALTLAVRSGDESVEMLAAATLATTCLLMGEPRPDLLSRSLELSTTHHGPRLGRGPLVSRAQHALWDGDLPAARRHLDALRRAFVSAGSEFQRPYRLLDLARLELACGHLAAAADLVDDGLESAGDARNGQAEMWLRHQEGLVWAHLGDHGRSERAADLLGRWGAEHDESPRVVMAHHVRGVDALARGDGEAAHRELLPAARLAAGAGLRHPGWIPVAPEAISACALVGDVDRGERPRCRPALRGATGPRSSAR